MNSRHELRLTCIDWHQRVEEDWHWLIPHPAGPASWSPCPTCHSTHPCWCPPLDFLSLGFSHYPSKSYWLDCRLTNQAGRLRKKHCQKEHKNFYFTSWSGCYQNKLMFEMEVWLFSVSWSSHPKSLWSTVHKLKKGQKSNVYNWVVSDSKTFKG